MSGDQQKPELTPEDVRRAIMQAFGCLHEVVGFRSENRVPDDVSLTINCVMVNLRVAMMTVENWEDKMRAKVFRGEL